MEVAPHARLVQKQQVVFLLLKLEDFIHFQIQSAYPAPQAPHGDDRTRRLASQGLQHFK